MAAQPEGGLMHHRGPVIAATAALLLAFGVIGAIAGGGVARGHQHAMPGADGWRLGWHLYRAEQRVRLQRLGMCHDRRERRFHGGELVDQQRHRRVSERVPVHLPGLPLGQLQLGRTDQHPSPTDPRLRDVAAILAGNPADGRTPAELGRTAGASERTLSRLFRRDTGMTFPQWRAQLRLQHATLLLAAGSTVTRAATVSGYSNTSAFIAAFRDAFGVTLAAYRHWTTT
jgi:AraC-like DNA-binding protein